MDFFLQLTLGILMDLKDILVGFFLFFYNMLLQSKWFLGIMLLGIISKWVEYMGWIESSDVYDEQHKKDVLFKRSVRKACNELELSNRTSDDLDKCIRGLQSAFSELQKK